MKALLVGSWLLSTIYSFDLLIQTIVECLTNICTFLFIKTSIVKNLSSMRTRLFLCEGGLPETQNNSRNGTDDGTERKWNGKCCDLHVWDTDHSVADLRGTRDARSPRCPNSFNFTQFLGKFGKIVCWRPPPPRVGVPTSGKYWVRHCTGHL